MTPERWREIEQLYQLVLGREEGQRAGFLEEACCGDEEMRREIESLLANAEPAERFMEVSGVALLAHAIARERQGSMVGGSLVLTGLFRSWAQAGWVKFTGPETRGWGGQWR